MKSSRLLCSHFVFYTLKFLAEKLLQFSHLLIPLGDLSLTVFKLAKQEIETS